MILHNKDIISGTPCNVILIFTCSDDGAGGRVSPRSVCVDTWHWVASRVLVMTWHVSGSRVMCHEAAKSQPALAVGHHKPPRASHLAA